MVRDRAGYALYAHAARADRSGEFDAIDTGFPVFNIKTLQLRIEDSMSSERMMAELSTAFGALALKVLGQSLSGATPVDVLTLVFAAGAMLAIAVAAVSVPAARAARIDPITALRQE